MKLLRQVGIVAIALLLGCFYELKAQEFDEVVANIAEELELSEEQVPKVNQLMTKYAVELNKTLAKHEDAAEPNAEAMVSDVRDVRDEYRKELSKALTKDQYNNYLGKVDDILVEMFDNLAEIRLLEMKPLFELTNDQVAALKPVYGKNMLAVVRILFENAGSRLTIPKKVSIANQVKKMQTEIREALELNLTPKQLTAYDAWKEEQKAAAEGS